MEYNKLLQEAEKSLEAAINLDKKGKSHQAFQEAEKAVDYFLKLSLWEKYIKARLIVGMQNHVVLGDKEATFLYWRETLAEAIGYLGTQHAYVADCYRCIGVTHSRFGDLPQGLVFFKKALQLRIDLDDGNKYAVAVLYNDIGLSFTQQGIRYEALQYLQKGLAILTSLLNKPKEQGALADKEMLRVTLARNYHILGHFYLNNELYDEALNYLHESLAQLERINGKEHPATCPILVLLAGCYVNKKDSELALSYAQSSLYLIQKHYGTDGFQIGSAWNIMSVCLQKKGEYNKALLYSEKSMKLFLQKLGDKHTDTASTYVDLACVYVKVEKYTEALEYFQKALKIQKDTFGEDSYKLITLYTTMGNTYYLMKEFEKALSFYQKTLHISLQTWGEKNVSVSNSYYFMGDVFTAQQQYAKALSFYQKSLQAACKDFEEESVYSNPDVTQTLFASTLFEPLHSKAKTLFQQFLQSKKEEDYEGALSTYQVAGQVLSSIRRSFQSEGSQLIFFRDTLKGFHENGIQTALHALSPSTCPHFAFNFSEKAKASLLLSNLQESFAKVSANIPQDLLRLEKDFKIKLTLLNKSIQQEETKGEQKDEKQLREWQNQFFDLYRTYLQFLEELEQNYPDYYQLKYDTQTITPTKLQPILQENQVVLSYFVGKEKLYIFTLTFHEFEVIDLQLPADFEGLVQEFMDALTQHQFTVFREKSHQLYQLLIAPIRDFIVDDFGLTEELKQVFVIPHGVLSYLPFEALVGEEPLPKFSTVDKVSPRTENSPTPARFADVWSGNKWNNLDYLIHHCEISYHYSATLLYRHLLQKQTEEEIPDSFAGFAPVYDIASPNSSSVPFKEEVSTTSKELQQSKTDALKQSAKAMQTWVTRSEAIRSDGTWVSLPHSETEAKGIAELFEEKGLEAKTFLREKASKEGFAEAAQQYKFLLVAAHGLVNDEKTALSGLVFYPSLSEHQISNSESPISRNEYRTSNHQPPITNHQPDSVLSMEETHHLDLQADLVVLSSCESGIGTLYKGEGMMAVNRGFLAAGANNVVSTLFKVYDKPSSLLTQYLFESILEGNSYSKALRFAKLKLMQEANIDPKSWSGFVLIGG